MIQHVSQLVFTRLNRSQSPNGKEGYQTLYYSKDKISISDVEEIEKRLVYYPTKKPVTKKQFFQTTSTKIVVAQTKMLDGIGKSGIYLSHCYVISPMDFLEAKNNPFIFFDQIAFLTNLEQAINSGDFKTGHIQSKNISVNVETGDSIGRIPNLHFSSKKFMIDLISLSSISEEMKADKNIIEFYGDHDEIESTIRLTIFFTPIKKRISCWFDTHYYRCNLPLGSYWAVGLPSPTMGQSYIHVDVSNRKVSGEIPRSSNPYYSTWLENELKSKNIASVIPQVETALLISEILVNPKYVQITPNISLNSYTVDEFYLLFEKEIISRIIEIVETKVGKSLSSKILPTLLNTYSNPHARINLIMGNDKSNKMVANIFYDILGGKDIISFSKKDFKKVNSFASQIDDTTLKALIAISMNDGKELKRILFTMGDQKFITFSKKALEREWLLPSEFIVPQKISLLPYLVLNFKRDEDFHDFVKLIILAKNGQLLEHFIYHLDSINIKTLRKISKLIKRKPVNAGFSNRVKNLLDQN